MTKAIEQNESFFKSAISFRRYTLLNCCFNPRFAGFIPNNHNVQLVVIPSSAMRNFGWSNPINESETVGSCSRIRKLHFGFEVNYFREVALFRSAPFTHDTIVHDKLRAITPSFVENTDDYTKRVFACEPFSI